MFVRIMMDQLLLHKIFTQNVYKKQLVDSTYMKFEVSIGTYLLSYLVEDNFYGMKNSIFYEVLIKNLLIIWLKSI